MLKIFMFLALSAVVCADQVWVMSNGPPTDRDYYQKMLEESDTAAVVNVDTFGTAFKKDRSWLGKRLKRTVPISVETGVRKIVCMNIPIHFYRDHYVSLLPKEKMVLFMWEPYIRMQKMYNPNLQECFSKIYTWNDDLVDNVKYFKFYYPVLRPMIANPVPFAEKKLCVLVTGYVNNPTRYPGELYSERYQAAQFFEQKGEAGFEYYGRGWEAVPPSPSFRGPCDDKIEVIKNFRFSICYENCRDVKGYITEKIFDCFAAGNVPVYWGASNVTDYIPKECFIDRRDFQNLDELYLFLKSMPEETYEGYLSHIREFLSSDAAHLFSEETFQEIFREALR